MQKNRNKENEEFFQDLVFATVEHFVTFQIPFHIIIQANEELQKYLPEEAFMKNALAPDGIQIPVLIISFLNWNLEIASVDEDSNMLYTTLVYGEATEYPIALPLENVFSVIDTASGVAVINKFFASPEKEEVKQGPLRSNNGLKMVLDEDGIKHSMSKLTLLKPGE